MKYALFSQDLELHVKWYDKFDRKQIKSDITTHLNENPSDTLELCKDPNKSDSKRFYGMEIIGFYATNPKTGNPSKIIMKGAKDYFRDLKP